MTITCSGCAVLADVIPPVVSTVGSYFSYEAANVDPVEVTTISKDCYIKKYISVNCALRTAIRATEDGESLLKNISDENKLYMEICPNAVKPDPISCH